MSSETKSDDELARDFERILESEHQLRLVWMKATGKSYEEAIEAFAKVKADAITKMVVEAKAAHELEIGASMCTCEEFRFPQDRRQYLKGTNGPHHAVRCVNWSDLRT